ncbi:MAG TPA: hypothetical protein VE616_15785 [Candidatus Udaeobacter sp.]|jgi:hypothetical protein|nr:hypothetical protein [Candidatus Udaeobacter sp.]
MRFGRPTGGDRVSQSAELLSGLTITVYGGALLVGHTYPKWVGGLAIAGGVPTMAAGIVMAYTRFSGLAMAIIWRRVPCWWCGCSRLEYLCGAEAEARQMNQRSNNRPESDAREARAAQPER